jgi:cell division initiation protein
MDVTPHDLRNAELREAFRGYRPDEVEELLERAAITLERMHERNRQLQEKIAGLEAEGSTAKEMESVLRQTLLLAQRTSDETVTAAHEKSRQLVEEAEDRAMTLTSEAEEQARIIGEAQRQKYEAIVSELSARRDLLTLDIDALERVQADYRGRLRAVLEKELEELDRRAALPTPAKPELHEIDLSAVPVPPDPAAAAFSGDTPEPPGVPSTSAPAATSAWGPPPESGEPGEAGPPTEALVVLDEELADSGPSGASSRRRG